MALESQHQRQARERYQRARVVAGRHDGRLRASVAAARGYGGCRVAPIMAAGGQHWLSISAAGQYDGTRKTPLAGNKYKGAMKTSPSPTPQLTPAVRPRKPRAPNAPPGAGTHRRGGRPASNAELVYRDLRAAIVSMSLPPGAAIVERELTARYGISRTPVREAVLRLAEERLVDVMPKSGTYVARIPLSLLREALVARRALEEVTVRAAAARASESQVLRLRAIIQHQQEMADAGDEEAFHRADEEFHAALCAVGRFPGFWDMIQQVRIHIERYRRLTLPQPGRMQLVVKEHGAVLDAIARGDADAAARHMTDHLNKLQLDIKVFRDLRPEYFIIDPELDDDLFDE